MSTLKQRIARRVKHAELAQKDAANRCKVCKVDLFTVPTVYTTLAGEKFCSWFCRDTFLGVGR